MIPSDITITPLSGSGDSSVSMTMEEYTGRIAKPTREVWIYDTEDTVSDMVKVDQYPKTEFIGLNDPLTFSVVALGGEITVTGTSNSSSLKPIEFDEALEFELSINGEVQSLWSPDNPTITGDIGADEEYSFSLKVTVPENQSTSQKPWTFQLSNNAQIVTATITINQAAGVRTYSDIVISEFSYPDAPAAGGILTPTLSYSQTWGWNGQTTGGGAINSGASLSYEAIGGWHQSVLDPATGMITAPSRGTVIAIQQTEFTAKVNVSLNGKTASLETDITQEKNVPISVAVTPSFTYPTGNIPASGGTKTPTPTGSIRITWSSGETSIADESGNSGYSTVRHVLWEMTTAEGFSINTATGTITAENRETTPGAARSCGDVTRTATITLTIDEEYGGGVISDTGEYILNSPITQEANIQTQTGIRIVGDSEGGDGWIPYEYWNDINAAGKASDTPEVSNTNGGAIRFEGYRQYSYTSGSSNEIAAGFIADEYSHTDVTWLPKHSAHGFNTSGANRTTVIGNERTAEVWWEDNGFESNHLSVTQAKNVPVSGETTRATFSYPDNVIPPAGGHAYAEPNGALRLTWSSGATSNPSQPTEDVSYVGHAVYTMTEAEGFSILDYSGRITATGMGSTLGSRSCGDVTKVLHFTVTISDTYGGGSFDTTSLTEVLTSPVTQGVNERIYDTPVITLGTPSDIPASGGTISSVSILSVVQPFHYTSGTTGTDTNPARTNEVWTPVIVPSKGTIITGRTVAGRLKYSCTCNGIQGSAAVSVYQEANVLVSQENSNPVLLINSGEAPATIELSEKGETVSVELGVSYTSTRTYTSGSTETTVISDNSFTWEQAVAPPEWLSIPVTTDSSMNVSCVANNEDTRSFTFKFKVTSIESKWDSINAEILFKQQVDMILVKLNLDKFNNNLQIAEIKNEDSVIDPHEFCSILNDAIESGKLPTIIIYTDSTLEQKFISRVENIEYVVTSDYTRYDLLFSTQKGAGRILQIFSDEPGVSYIYFQRPQYTVNVAGNMSDTGVSVSPSNIKDIEDNTLNISSFIRTALTTITGTGYTGDIGMDIFIHFSSSTGTGHECISKVSSWNCVGGIGGVEASSSKIIGSFEWGGQATATAIGNDKIYHGTVVFNGVDNSCTVYLGAIE